MRKLIRGLIDFRKNIWPGVRSTFAQLALGQKPDSLFIACSDSRVVPNLFASTDPGDLFVIRNVGNLVPPSDSVSSIAEGAAIEFAVLDLKVRDIIVCGHSECGATQALLKPVDIQAPHLREWLRNGQEAVIRLKAGLSPDPTLARHNQVSQLNTLLQLDHLKTYPAVRERWLKGKLGLHAWWFDIKNAEVYNYDEELGKFVIIDEAEANRMMANLAPEDQGSTP